MYNYIKLFINYVFYTLPSLFSFYIHVSVLVLILGTDRNPHLFPSGT